MPTQTPLVAKMVVNFFIVGGDGNTTEMPSIPLVKAIEETIHIKRDSGRRPTYVNTLRQYLNQFAKGRENVPVNRITEREIQKWFADRNEKPVTRAANLGRLSALFGVCWRRGYIAENPIHKIEKPYVDRRAPSILTLRQCAKLLVFARRQNPNLLAWLSLALLAGVRPEECLKLDWSNIDLARGELRVDAAASKVRTRRLVRLSPACRAWLWLAKQMGATLPKGDSTHRRYVKHMRRILGFKSWPQDILRHTAASYLLARHQDAGKVAMMLGNSADILNQHYKELVPLEKGVRFSSLLPSPAMVRRVA
jgi:integrase/recombinase XerD